MVMKLAKLLAVLTRYKILFAPHHVMQCEANTPCAKASLNSPLFLDAIVSSMASP
eukprot:c41479_g1_i1 orf=62-226(+)